MGLGPTNVTHGVVVVVGGLEGGQNCLKLLVVICGEVRFYGHNGPPRTPPPPRPP